MTFGGALSGVRSEMVDFGPRQGRTRVFAAGVAVLRRGRKPAENAASGQNMPFVDEQKLEILLPRINLGEHVRHTDFEGG